MNWRFVDLPIVLALHSALIEQSGGSPGLRDLGLLESAIARAENKVNYDQDATVASVGASLCYGLEHISLRCSLHIGV